MHLERNRWHRKIIFSIILMHICCLEKSRSRHRHSWTYRAYHIIAQLNNSDIVLSVSTKVHISLSVIINKNTGSNSHIFCAGCTPGYSSLPTDRKRIFERSCRTVAYSNSDSVSSVTVIQIKLVVAIDNWRCPGHRSPPGISFALNTSPWSVQFFKSSVDIQVISGML